MRTTEMEILLSQLCKTEKSPEIDGYDRDIRLRSEKLKTNEVTTTETRKKRKREKKKP